MRYLVIFLLVIPTIAKAQKKKDFEAYWAQHDIDEKYNIEIEAAHTAFKNGNLELAMVEYLDALKIKPYDQFAIAKLTDLKILQKEGENPELEREEIVAIVKKEVTDLQLEVVPELAVREIPSIEMEQPKVEEAIETTTPIETVNMQEVAEKADEVDIVIIAKPKIEEKKLSDSSPNPTKYNSEFSKKLAEEYEAGITETIDNTTAKTTITRIVVQNGGGTEYQKVIHNWGGVYYFKNGKSTTERVWLTETVAQKSN